MDKILSITPPLRGFLDFQIKFSASSLILSFILIKLS